MTTPLLNGKSSLDMGTIKEDEEYEVTNDIPKTESKTNTMKN